MEKHTDQFKDKIKGGLADASKPSDFEGPQLEKGIKVEMEHTNSKQMAKEIAMDHLTEDPKYYDKLEKMEKGAFWEGFGKQAGSAREDKPLYQPMKSTRPEKKKMVYVKGSGGKPKLIHYGATGYKHNYSEGAKKNFRARHGCDKPGLDKNSPRYWACQDLWPKTASFWDGFSKNAGIAKGLLEGLLGMGELNAESIARRVSRGARRTAAPATAGGSGAYVLNKVDNKTSEKKAAVPAHIAEIAGLSLLARPYIGKGVPHKDYKKYELAGLGTLALPSAYALGKRLLKVGAVDPYSEKKTRQRELGNHLSRIRRNRIEPNKPPKPPKVSPTTGPNYG